MRLALALVLAACTSTADQPTFEWDLPAGYPRPVVPSDNPMSAAKVELGRHLFYDVRLSINETTSCGTCHHQARGFADGEVLPRGATGDVIPRNSPGLQNVAYMATYTWPNPILETLEAQVVVPMFGEHPIELGMSLDEPGILARFENDPGMRALFEEAFPGDGKPVTRTAVIHAVASFVRSMISGRAAYDRYAYGGEATALSESARRGLDLFTSERLECYHCHAANLNFTSSFRVEGQGTIAHAFENDGLYNIGGTGAYPPQNRGLIEFSNRPADEGKFRVPSLRNIALTAPYMHDGSLATLDEVIDMYARGGRLIQSGPLAGDGAENPNKSLFVRGFTLSSSEREDLKAFLESLTDHDFLVDPRFGPPQ